MADVSDPERRKKHKKKHKKKAKSSDDHEESLNVSPEDTNTSTNKETGSANQETSANKAPKTNAADRDWTWGEEEELLQKIREYATNLKGRQEFTRRINWHMITMKGFTQVEMEERYKLLSKKVRKSRSAKEIVEDALTLHKEQEFKPNARSITNSENKKPKQAPTAFALFVKAKRPSLVAKHPGLSFSETHQKICKKWKELPEEKRKKYIKKAEKAKLQYYEELQKYHDFLLSSVKKPKSAYELWVTERLKDHDGGKTEDDLILQWNDLAEATKKGWLQAAACEQEWYSSEINKIKVDKGINLRKSKQKEVNGTERNSKTGASDNQHASSSKSISLKRKLENIREKSPVAKAVKEMDSSAGGGENSQSGSS